MVGIAGTGRPERLKSPGQVCLQIQNKMLSKLVVRGGIGVGTVVACALFAGCASSPPEPERVALPEVTHFSDGKPGEALPGGWRLWTFSRFKKPTSYHLVSDDGRTVIRASADSSASGLVHDVRIDPRRFPVIHWHWKVTQAIPNADNTKRQFEDSPARVVVSFSGDASKFSFDDKMFASQVKAFTGQELPYATLMYIWGNRRPPESVITNSHTGRIKMIVVQSGRDKVGNWVEETRNIVDDYRKAFGEEPSTIHSVGIMTDTDNTESQARAYYGDISFLKARPK